MARIVQLLNQRLHQCEVRRTSPDDDAPGSGLRDHRDPLAGPGGDRCRIRRGHRLSGLLGDTERILAEQLRQRPGHHHRIRIFERIEAELRFVPIEVERQLADEAVNGIQFLRWPRQQDGICGLVNRHHDFNRRCGFGGRSRRIGRHARGCRWRRWHFVGNSNRGARHLRVNGSEHFRHLLGRHAVERTEPHLDSSVLAGLIEARHEILDLGEVPPTGNDGERVVGRVGLDHWAFGTGAILKESLQFGNHVISLCLA